MLNKSIKINETNFFTDQMSEFKQLNGGVYFVEYIPTTPSGKMIRTRVKDVVVKLHRKRKCQPELNFMLKIERS